MQCIVDIQLTCIFASYKWVDKWMLKIIPLLASWMSKIIRFFLVCMTFVSFHSVLYHMVGRQISCFILCLVPGLFWFLIVLCPTQPTQNVSIVLPSGSARLNYLDLIRAPYFPIVYNIKISHIFIGAWFLFQILQLWSQREVWIMYLA